MTPFRTSSQQSILSYDGAVYKFSIIVGPESVGKWHAADLLRKSAEAAIEDSLFVDKNFTKNFEYIENFSKKPPVYGPWRFILIRADNPTRSDFDRLLKVVEDSAETTRFILTTSTMPPKTLTSRAKVVKFRKLSRQELEKLLQEKFNMTEVTAREAAKRSNGTVAGAFKYLRTSEARETVVKAMDAVQRLDEQALFKLDKDWTEEHTALLIEWAQESLTEPVIFEEDQLAENKLIPISVLTELYGAPRARYVVKNYLTKVMEVAKLAN